MSQPQSIIADDWLVIITLSDGRQLWQSHEMCGRYRCVAGWDECPFHQDNCGCSNGECQK